MTTQPLRTFLALVAVCALAGCGPKIVRERIYDKPDLRVELRHESASGASVAHDYTHPATIADVRIAHILANLSFDDSDGKRRPAIRSQFIYDLADGISAALLKAGPDDEVAAAVFSEDRRLAIFSDEHVTAFRLYVRGDEMRIDFYALEQAFERESNRVGSRDYEIPTELPGFEPKFALVAAQAQRRTGPRSLEIAWRDPFYRRPVTLSFRGGQLRRRTVLMELPSEAEVAPTTETPLPANLSDAQLRALDELDSGRQSGLVTESEYQRRRRLVLENKLDEAGYGVAPR